MRSPTRSADLAFLAAVLAFVLCTPVAATNYEINTLQDDSKVNGNCTLREALRAADGDVAVDGCSAGTLDDSIVLPSGTYGFGGEEALSGAGSLRITSATLNPFHVIVDLQGFGRFLALTGGGSYVIGGVGITNGLAGDDDGRGGAVRAENVTLEIFNFRLLSNTGGSEGGALYYFAFAKGAEHRLTLANGTFFDNHVTNAAPFPSPAGNGGAAYVSVGQDSDAYLRDVAFIGNSLSNSGRDGGGGALAMFSFGPGSLASCLRCNFDGNSAVETLGGSRVLGGAARVGASGPNPSLGPNGALNLVDCRFLHNFARAAAGGAETAVLYADAFEYSSINLERLFVDDNWGPGTHGSTSRDVYVASLQGSILSLTNAQITFGGLGGLVADVNAEAFLNLGHLTIADYPGRGVLIRSSGTGQAVLQNSIVTFNASNLAIEGSLSQTTNFVGGDPHFVDELNGNYRLGLTSLAIDAGTSGLVTFRTHDLDYHARRAGFDTDVGCYEFGSL